MSAGSSSRPLGNLEVFFQKLADLGAPLQREHWAVHLALGLQFIEHGAHSPDFDPVPYLQTAWKAVRHQHPAIGSVIRAPDHLGGGSSTTTRGVLTIPASDTNSWIKETFFVHPDEVDADALFCDLRPASTVTCHWLPRSSEILIRSSHWRLDGVGIAKLGHAFMNVLAEALSAEPEDVSAPASATRLASSIQSLPPNVEEVARIWSERQGMIGGKALEEGSARSRLLESGADALVSEFLRGVPSIGLPTRAGSAEAVPGPSARVSTQLSVPATARFMEARRSKNLSFTGAVHAAIVRVTARLPQHPLAKSYAAFFPVDLRHSITSSGAATEDQLMFGLYFSGLPICIENVVPAQDGKAKGFEEVARQMTAAYTRDLTAFWTAPDGSQVSLMELAETYLEKTTVLFNTPTPEGLPPVETPDLSGLGRVEKYLQRHYQSGSSPRKVEVSGVWVGTEMLNRCVQFHLWSWQDQFHLGASFNQSFYQKASIAALLNQIVEELLRGLEIQE